MDKKLSANALHSIAFGPTWAASPAIQREAARIQELAIEREYWQRKLEGDRLTYGLTVEEQAKLLAQGYEFYQKVLSILSQP